MRSDTTLNRTEHAISYYEELGDSTNFTDYCVSHNRDERIEKLFTQIDPGKLIESACTYPFHLYDTFRAKVRELYGVKHFILGSGSEDLIFRLNQYFLHNVSTGVVLPNFYRIYKTCQNIQYFYTNSSEPLDINALEQWILQRNLKTLWISNPNPIYGEGYERASLLYLLSKYPQVLFIVDEANIEFSQERQDLELLAYTAMYDNLVVIRSFSKFFSLPGIRIGLLFTENEKVLDFFAEHSQVFSISGPSIILANHALENHQFFHSLTLEIAQYKTSLNEILRKTGMVNISKSSANTLFLSSERLNLWELLMQKGILTLNLAKELGIKEKNAIRITIHSSPTLFKNLSAKIEELNHDLQV